MYTARSGVFYKPVGLLLLRCIRDATPGKFTIEDTRALVSMFPHAANVAVYDLMDHLRRLKLRDGSPDAEYEVMEEVRLLIETTKRKDRTQRRHKTSSAKTVVSETTQVGSQFTSASMLDAVVKVDQQFSIDRETQKKYKST